jgi:plasmid maintenance system antidote protein VapI
VDELNQNHAHRIRLKDLEHNDKIFEITDKYRELLLIERKKYEDLINEKNNLETSFNIIIKNLEKKNTDELKNLESKYKLKQNVEHNRHKVLMNEIEGIY